MGKYLLPLLLIALPVGAWYYYHLSNWSEQQFSKTQKWNLASKVFSDAEYLYPGVNLPARKLIAKLNRLGYRDVGATEVKGAGEFSAAADHLDIFLHDFTYPMEAFTGFPVRIIINGANISRLINLNTKQDVTTVRLEPELISNIFD
ncbi:MAG: hypothetical protein Q7T25_01630, partial [Sideroxyarcus sp.]|nr:hypothetical protein [Sideroxyarcus sp.]